MKQLQFILLFIILIGMASCEPPVTFSEPQPAETSNLSKFPNRLQGHYLSLADNSILQISDKLIQRIYDFDQKIHPNQLDSNLLLSGDTIINLTNHITEIIKRDGDSLVKHMHYIDTLFEMSYDNVVRKFKGYYFLNIRYNKENWEVKKIELLKGELIISSISTNEDIEKLQEITESAQDTVAPRQFAATKKQFKEFVKHDGFTDSELFIRQNKKP